MVISESQSRYAEGWSEADYVGGHPALDFINTVADTGKTRLSDKIGNWDGVRKWAGGAGLLPRPELAAFFQDASLDDDDELARLHRFREQAYEAMLGLVGRTDTGSQSVIDLERSIRDAMGRGAFSEEGRQFRWQPDARSPQRWLDAVALCFEEFLRSEDVTRLRQCTRCTWFFVDRGRGAGRRWCDMRTCGNRAKAEAFRCR
ncbi:CGNR zinc finger domain-containing protein [Labrys sp. KB_33_2]|uniref:CGNR zinc finger domain-containing protein n=1 Tax=Labrys sp. KB_33_2 TaxID=3237479 RepID=UPI003F90C944